MNPFKLILATAAITMLAVDFFLIFASLIIGVPVHWAFVLAAFALIVVVLIALSDGPKRSNQYAKPTYYAPVTPSSYDAPKHHSGRVGGMKVATPSMPPSMPKTHL